MLSPDGIADLCLAWPAGQATVLKLTPNPAPGRTLADWASFVLTIRADPKWPRQGADLFAQPDPVGEGWAVAVSAAGTPDPPPGPYVTFPFTVPLAPGVRRYVLDARGVGGAAGEVAFVRATWLTVTPAVRG